MLLKFAIEVEFNSQQTQSFVYQNLYFDPAIFCPARSRLVGCRRICRAHGSGRYDVPNGHIAVLQQERNNFLGAFHTQLLVHRGIP